VVKEPGRRAGPLKQCEAYTLLPVLYLYNDQRHKAICSSIRSNQSTRSETVQETLAIALSPSPVLDL
jgi:hypothetical protein